MPRAERLNGKAHAILEHVARYQLSFEETIRRTFYPDKSLQAVRSSLGRLASPDGRKHLITRLHDDIRYFQITALGADRLGLPQRSMPRLTSAQLHEAIAVLWFCRMNSIERRRLPFPALSNIFPGMPLDRPYCSEIKWDGQTTVYRVYARPQENQIHCIAVEADRLSQNPATAQYLTDPAEPLAFAALVETPALLDQAKQQLQQMQLPIPVLVEVAATPATVREMLEAATPIQTTTERDTPTT